MITLNGIMGLVLIGAFRRCLAGPLRRRRVHQTGRHRDFFLPVTSDGTVVESEEHANPPTDRAAPFGLALLAAALVSVVGLAKSPSRRWRPG